jgi:hypothetical protein
VDNPDLIYDYNVNDDNSAVMGGNGILAVAAWPEGSDLLMDYVHCRIRGDNPDKANVVGYIDRVLAAKDQNIRFMIRAIYAHEAGYKQFKAGAQTSSSMTFKQKHHNNDTHQPNCTVNCDFPDDPEWFPNVSFDFGVGISQFTKTLGRTIEPAVAWDWRGNVNIGINLFLSNLRATKKPGDTWIQWARKAWKRYNGSGPQAVIYANNLATSADGQQVATSAAPTTVDLSHVLSLPSLPGSCEVWPPDTIRTLTARAGGPVL